MVELPNNLARIYNFTFNGNNTERTHLTVHNNTRIADTYKLSGSHLGNKKQRKNDLIIDSATR